LSNSEKNELSKTNRFFWNIEKEKYGKIKSVLWKKQDGKRAKLNKIQQNLYLFSKKTGKNPKTTIGYLRFTE
jgi:hypothetical protein